MYTNTHGYSKQHGVNGVPEWKRLQVLVPYCTKHWPQCRLKLINGEHYGRRQVDKDFVVIFLLAHLF